ncbi:hypothetical protein [Brevundimonas sp. FT23042]|uniref:hypothetical protein n=1 Tax=Brevundimonas sp. FT23042 TaxID=3393749 RepID=UPI003B585F96
MKVLRFLVALAILAYVGWLAWPLLSPLIDGGAPDPGAMRMEVESVAGGDLFGFIPAWVLWAGAVGLYLVAALMLGAGNPRASIAYFVGFIADAVLRLAMDRNGGPDAAARSSAPTTMAADAGGLPVEPLWLILGGLFLLGVLVIVVARRQRKHRIPGQLSF